MWFGSGQFTSSMLGSISKFLGMGERQPRWWLLWVILSLLLITFLVVAGHDFEHRQGRVMALGVWLVVGFAFVLMWILALSNMRWAGRFALGGLWIGMAVCPALFLEYRGVTGDLIPIFGWRWKDRSPEHSGANALVAGDLAEALDRGNYAQFLGPDRNAKLSGFRLQRDWTVNPPVEIWRKYPIGDGWSGFSVFDDICVTMVQDGEQEVVLALELGTGKEVWRYAYEARYDNAIGGIGPRATPTIDDGRVYALGATGILHCLHLSDGAIIWSKDIRMDNDAEIPEWGFAGSPLIQADLVIVAAGGPKERSLVAYDKVTGDFRWGGGSVKAGYSSPYPCAIAGASQILVFNFEAMAGHSAEDGKVLWRQPWPSGHPHVANPVVLPDDRVLVSSGYGTGSKLLQITRGEEGFGVSTLWKSIHLKAKFTNVVEYGGFIYGLDDGILVCMDLSNGKRRWKRGRYGHGQVILVENLLLLLAENGDVVLIEPDPKEHRELHRFSALQGKTWNPPALAGPFLLVRNQYEAACYRLALE